MPTLEQTCDGRGFVVCRYCRHARPPGRDSGAPWTCEVGDNPGPPLDPDVAKCDYGELVDSDEIAERSLA